MYLPVGVASEKTYTVYCFMCICIHVYILFQWGRGSSFNAAAVFLSNIKEWWMVEIIINGDGLHVEGQWRAVEDGNSTLLLFSSFIFIVFHQTQKIFLQVSLSQLPIGYLILSKFSKCLNNEFTEKKLFCILIYRWDLTGHGGVWIALLLCNENYPYFTDLITSLYRGDNCDYT